jgi:integrase
VLAGGRGRRQQREAVVTFGLDDFTGHDLRRTAASYMTSIGIPRFTVARLLNHAESGVTAVYDRHSYDIEKRDALERWALKLRKIIEARPGELVEFPK